MNNIDFSKNLIKGKIAETIFEQMFRDNGNYTILRFGFEHTIPELAQYRATAFKRVVDDLSDAPDFVLFSNDKKEVYVVEVKYRATRNNAEIKKIAEKTLKHWNPSFLFIASLDGFFFGPCNEIVINNGEIGILYDKWASKETQGKYLQLLREFEQ
ncbi:hypothetical protein A2V71_02535 [Candidatus Berkelbacteria bacterium RBG_13_40_8]|uniref:Uncharacterized protein n=1 Tax=Candidatus Berkelbacteria bacterium RBG_13_40_8 TaxID=1797467 RepID=A0A1F5DNC1_9BACT|nr:MAG: hypothetical protein A2V71_02535 [Candidatus Berkelbacteria bacterium RBG_13_40_8]